MMILFYFPQSNYSSVPKIPFRACLMAPSNSGKTILIQNLLLDVYIKIISRRIIC